MGKDSINLKEARDAANQAKDKAEKAQDHSELNRHMIWAVLWVAVVGFVALLVTVVGMLFTYMGERAATYQSLVEKINNQTTVSKNLETKLDCLIAKKKVC